jgi:hypothetical protein
MKHALQLFAFTAALGLVSATAASAIEASARAPIACFGGAQEFVNHITDNTARARPPGAAGVMPSTAISGGPSGAGSDVYVVTFSGEASIPPGGAGFWTAQAFYNVGAGPVPMDPIGPNTFHSGVPPQTHTMTWCRRLSVPNNVVFTIVWQKFGAGPAVIDDSTMRVERSD